MTKAPGSPGARMRMWKVRTHQSVTMVSSKQYAFHPGQQAARPDAPCRPPQSSMQISGMVMMHAMLWMNMTCAVKSRFP